MNELIITQWLELFVDHKTKVLGFDIDDLLKIREYLNVNKITPKDLLTSSKRKVVSITATNRDIIGKRLETIDSKDFIIITERTNHTKMCSSYTLWFWKEE